MILPQIDAGTIRIGDLIGIIGIAEIEVEIVRIDKPLILVRAHIVLTMIVTPDVGIPDAMMRNLD